MQAEYLPDAVSSVAGQTFDDFEIVIVDDGSPDDTSVVARRLAERDARIRLHSQTNGGVSAARNAGISVAAGDLILPLDADDRLRPTMIAWTVAALDAAPDAAFAYTDYRFFGEVERDVRTIDFDVDRLMRANYITASALIRREALAAVGGYRTSMALGYEDWDLWLSLAEQGFTGVHVAEILFEYRVRAGSRNSEAKANQAAIERQIRAAHPSLFTRSRVVRGLAKAAAARLRSSGVRS